MSTAPVIVVLLVAVALTLALQAWTTTRVWRSEWFVRAQKLAQSKLIWMLPLIGALVVLLAHQEIAKEDAPRKAKTELTDSA